jgi:hypothetical protein
LTALDDIVNKFRKGSPNIAAAFDEVQRRLTLLEQPVPPPAGWPPVDTTPPAWTPKTHVIARSDIAFNSAYVTAIDGDLIDVRGATFTRQLNLNRKFAKEGVEIRFGDAVTFRGDPTRDLNAVYVTGTKHRIFGGSLSNHAGHGILFHASSDVLWHGFNVAGVGGSCLRVFAVGGNVERLDLVGEVSDCGHDLSLDPHAEKGTGLHPSYIGGGSDPSLAVTNSRFIIDAHDCATGSNQIGPYAVFNDFYYRAKNLTMVAKQQTAGNAAQPFGDSAELDIWVEADNVAQVVRPAGNLRNIRVWHGRGTNVRGNWDSKVPYMPHPAVTYQDCTP